LPEGTLLVATFPTTFTTPTTSFTGIVAVDPNSGAQSPVSPLPGQRNLFSEPTYIAEGPDGMLYVTDLVAFGTGAVIRVNPNTGEQSLIAKGAPYINGPNVLTFVNGSLYVANDAV